MNASIEKPKILLLADQKNWAFDIAAKAMSKELAGSFDFEIEYVQEKPMLNEKKFDLIYVYFWGETYHRQFIKDPKKIIKEVSSHRWENEELYGFLSPQEFAKKHLSDAGHVVTTSKRLQKIIEPYREMIHCPNGFDPEIFYNRNMRNGKLKIGWAGNEKDACKGINDIIKPACGNDFELHIAGGNLNQQEMAEFYNQIDVLCVASTAEGEPLPLIESMACGCFPVCTDVGIVPELIREKDNGLIVERSIGAFKEAFLWCRENLTEIREKGRNNAEQLKETRTWKNVAPIFEKMLWKVLNENEWERKYKKNSMIEFFENKFIRN